MKSSKFCEETFTQKIIDIRSNVAYGFGLNRHHLLGKLICLQLAFPT